jgi:predicted metal-dependent enzyme (double-stranded beta helix superfamily)
VTAAQPAAEEYLADAAVLRLFIDTVKDVIASVESPAAATRRLRAPFARLLADRAWLPETFRVAADASGMGGGIGQYLLYRSADRTVTLFSLVIPPGATTPVHDHLAWGLVGVYDGTQEERIYRLAGAHGPGHAALEVSAVRQLAAGDFYDLIPPEDDIHSVRTTSLTPSVSLHLLARDIGCIWRHKYHPAESTVEQWRSGYVNAPCDDDGAR